MQGLSRPWSAAETGCGPAGGISWPWQDLLASCHGREGINRSGALLQGVERFGQDCLAVLVVAALAHVGEVGLVGLGLRRRRRVLAVPAGRKAAARAVPDLRDLSLGRERRPALVLVRAPEGNTLARRGLAALGLTHRTGSD